MENPSDKSFDGADWKALCDRIEAREERAIRKRVTEMPLPIAHCHRLFSLGCPGTWQALTPTETEKIRRCPTCRRRVYLVAYSHEIPRHEGEPVVVAFPEIEFDYQTPPQEFLLRGSDGPDGTSEELLRAAREQAEIHPEELLRAPTQEHE